MFQLPPHPVDLHKALRCIHLLIHEPKSKYMRSLAVLLSCAALSTMTVAQTPPAGDAGRRFLTPDDIAHLREVGDPQVSPEGDWVAYTLRVADLKSDKRTMSIRMVSWTGGQTLQLTQRTASCSKPRWSPDGKFLGFLSGRDSDNEHQQVWLMDRRGGEPEKITSVKGSVLDYSWSPDGTRLALVVMDPDSVSGSPEPGDEKAPPRPLVIDRFQFKEDDSGYLTDRRQHLFLFDLASRLAFPLTPGKYNEALPSWSPDGLRIAFVSKRSADMDRDDNYDIYLLDAKPGAVPRQLTTFEGADASPDWDSPPAWSPDGTMIAYVQGGRPELIFYAVRRLAIVSVAGGATTFPAPNLDRNVTYPRWTPDGRALLCLMEDDGTRVPVRVPANGGKIEKLFDERCDIAKFSSGLRGQPAFLYSTPQTPYEIVTLEGGRLRPLTSENAAWLSGVRLARTEEIRCTSTDGALISGFVVSPRDATPGTPSAAILRIHGGPVNQFSNQFMMEWQLFAARGYVVVAMNPRGSSGRGEAFSRAIFSDWGNKDAQDVLAGVDEIVKRGIADRNRLGIGGWSYGGMLTNYVIVQDGRFKAATSGASISNQLAGYGTDQYVREYEAELGVPWKNLDAWLKVSFPFYKADRITTPTLFLCGESDFNVPLLNSEQMYQALRSLGRETQLIIYPGEHHGISRPSFVRDRMERYLAWYDRYLSPRH
jgi:dipeptidyl aminopeptidase/acylaminoacyl peptidase